ncbi:hypothetical protein [Roseovarius tolerans]|uniref:hypothetical protein n=1 Tax=Roseovarius tolerans TaxID=74031 RepID=UPI00237D495C|nr:hypothetical protein [Roseovarius tolerans]
MLETLGTLVANPILDLTLKIVGVAGLIVAVLAWKAATASVKATKAANITSLKMKAVDSTAAAERSFVSLQSNYQSVSAAWQEHINQHHAPMYSFRNKPDELERNAQVEREGANLMQKLEQNLDCLDQDGLERFIKEAQRTAIDIERLSFRLERPQSLRH